MNNLMYVLPLISASAFASESLYSNDVCGPTMTSVYSKGNDYGSLKIFGKEVKGVKVDIYSCTEQNVCKFTITRANTNSWSGMAIANSAKTTINQLPLSYDRGEPIIYYAYTSGSTAGQDSPGQCFINNLNDIGFNKGRFVDNDDIIMESTGLTVSDIQAMGFKFR